MIKGQSKATFLSNMERVDDLIAAFTGTNDIIDKKARAFKK